MEGFRLSAMTMGEVKTLCKMPCNWITYKTKLTYSTYLTGQREGKKCLFKKRSQHFTHFFLYMCEKGWVGRVMPFSTPSPKSFCLHL